MASATKKNHLRHVLSETTAILNSKPLHFITFSLLFFPLTITTISIIQSSSADVTFKTLTSSAYVTFKTLITLIPIILSTFTAITLITYTTLKIIINPKITTSLTFKSLFKPLLSTIFSETIHLLFISLAFTHFSFSLTNLIKSLTFSLVFRFDVLLVSFAFALCVLLVTFMFFKAALGFESQPSSFWLSSFYILLYAVFGVGLLLWQGAIVYHFRPVSKWLLVLQICGNYMYCSVILTQFVVLNTVLYVRCKVASGELAVKSAVDDECVRSGFDLTMIFLQYVKIGILFIGLAN